MATLLVLLLCFGGLLKSSPSASSGPDAMALRRFLDEVKEDPFGALSSWTMSNDNCCAWFGIVCNVDGRVVSVLLPDQQIEGALTRFFQDLSFLEILSLQNNSLSGPLPAELGSLHNLQVLNLSWNQMDGYFPQAIMDLPRLKYLDIRGNSFAGSVDVPASFRNFKYSSNVGLQVMKDGGKEEDLWKPLIGLTIIALATSIFLVIFCHFLRKWSHRSFSGKRIPSVTSKTSNGASLQEESSFPRLGSKYMDIQRFPLNEMRAATKGFSEAHIVGAGGFGTIYRAVLPDGEMVALKRAHTEFMQSSGEFQNEVKVLSRVHHRNLIHLLGFCEESYEQILVYEYAVNGSLLDHFTGVRELLTWRQRVLIAIGAAKGLTYLHEGCSPSIIHRDIKPSNILLGFNYEAKVSDFGLSKHGPGGNRSHVSTLVKGTFGYVDPQYYESFHLTTASDVYSFGVILLQLVTARPALDHTRKHYQHNIVTWVASSMESGRLEDILDPFLVLQGYDAQVMLCMAQLGLRCTSSAAKLRPSISRVSLELEAALRDHDIKLSEASPLTSAGLRDHDDIKLSEASPLTAAGDHRRMSEASPLTAAGDHRRMSEASPLTTAGDNVIMGESSPLTSEYNSPRLSLSYLVSPLSR